MKNKIFKIVFIIAIVFLLICVFSIKVYADSEIQVDTVKIYDLADQLTDAEESQLLQKAQSLATQHKLNIIFVTTDTMSGLTAERYTDRFYDGFGPDKIEFADDGLLFLCTTDNEVYINTVGKAITYITDREIDWTLDRLSRNQTFYERFSIMLENTIFYFEDDTDNYSSTKTFGKGLAVAGICLGLSVLIDIPVYLGNKKKKISAHKALSVIGIAQNYTGETGLTVVSNTEKLIDSSRRVLRGYYASSSSSGGYRSSGGGSFHGGSSHSSSTRSGGSRSHGGGGRRL